MWHHAPGIFRPGVWHSLKLVVRGKSVKCFIDQKLLVSDLSPTLDQGSVGLTSRCTVAKFRRIKVTDASGRVLFEGFPALDPIPSAAAVVRSR
jgi:hypothetical protein